MKEVFPTIRRKAIDILLQFSTSYNYEQAFTYLTSIKSKDRNRLLSIENEIHVCLSKVRPRIKYLCRNRYLCEGCFSLGYECLGKNSIVATVVMVLLIRQ